MQNNSKGKKDNSRSLIRLIILSPVLGLILAFGISFLKTLSIPSTGLLSPAAQAYSDAQSIPMTTLLLSIGIFTLGLIFIYLRNRE